MTGPHRYLLDTNIVSDLINNGRASAVAGMLDQHGASVCISIVVASEIRYGVAKKGSRALADRAEAILKAIPNCSSQLRSIATMPIFASIWSGAARRSDATIW